MGLKNVRKISVQAAIGFLASVYISNSAALIAENSHQPRPAATQDSENVSTSADMLDRVINFEHEKLANQRERFLEAEKALQKRQLTKFRELSTSIEDYPLYPYLRYQEIQRRLSRAGTEELEQFLEEYADQPVSHLLQSKLLNHYARRGQWKRFLTFYTPQRSPRLQCDHSYALLRTNNAEAAYPLIEKLWLTGKSLPSNCDRVFKKWKAAGKLTPELVWKRFELALNNGKRPLAKYLVRSLPTDDRRLAKTWIKLYKQPERLPQYLTRLTDSQHVKAPTMLLQTAERLANKYPEQAAEIFTNTDLLAHVADEEKYNLQQTLAISLALKHLEGAEDWFKQIPDEFYSDTGREWRIRVALRESQWQTALNAINNLPSDELDSDRWQYWRARVLSELDNGTDAMTLFNTLAKKRSYYGFLSADRLGLPYAITDHPHQPEATELFSIIEEAGIRRARELFQLERMVDARREWYQSTSSMTNEQRIDASKLAQLWGWTGQSILTIAKTNKRDDIGLRFPLLLQEKVLTHSENASIDPAWTYGVIRRESAFIKDARSSKGAVGLMQLMPATAKRMSKSIKEVNYKNSAQLVQPDTNIALGTHYLNMMLERFNGQTVLATAAYNAGEHRVDKWLPKEDELDAERWIETIPFKETREYVANVLAYTVIYSELLGLKNQRLSERMKTVIPKDELLSRKEKDKEQVAALNDSPLNQSSLNEKTLNN